MTTAQVRLFVAAVKPSYAALVLVSAGLELREFGIQPAHCCSQPRRASEQCRVRMCHYISHNQSAAITCGCSVNPLLRRCFVFQWFPSFGTGSRPYGCQD